MAIVLDRHRLRTVPTLPEGAGQQHLPMTKAAEPASSFSVCGAAAGGGSFSSGSSSLAKWDTQQVQLIAAPRFPVRGSLFQQKSLFLHGTRFPLYSTHSSWQ